jgi:signal transduction histidine kinase/DNA-binding response OmpR family regulator
MNSLARLKKITIRYAHVLLVVVAFTMMVLSSYLFVSKMESRHLKRSAESAIRYTEASIKSDMLELETLLGVVSETISSMLVKGDDSDAINEYILLINNYVEADRDKRSYGATGIFGVFDVFDGLMLIGFENWTPPDDYYQTDRPWYDGAIKAAGEISISEPYVNAYSNEITITLSRQIFDNSGNSLGIICLNIELERIEQYVVNTQFVEGGYGFLLSENIMIIAHPNPVMVGLSFRNMKSGIATYIDRFAQAGGISEFVTTDYRGVMCIVFVQRLQNGWYMGVATPRDRYFESTKNLAITLTAFGTLFAALLIWLLLKISTEKAAIDARMKIMFKDLQQRARLLNTVYSAATVLLSNYARESFEASLLKSLELVGRCLDVDRVQIWRNDVFENESHFVLEYEWLSDYGKGCKSIPLGLHFPYSAKKEWYQKFINHEYINAPVCELPTDDQSFLMPYDIKSIVILPMFLEGDFWGFFSIDDCRNERILVDEEISILASAGLMMTSAVNRNTQTVKMREADERTQIMFDAAPLGIFFWDKNLNIIDCNQEAVKLFDLSSKQEFIDRFFWMSPEYQPDGIASKDKGPKLVSKALEEGYSRFEWVHQKLNGEQIPAEITCIRVKHRDEYTVTEYIRDLREQKAMLAEMRKVEIAEESNKAKSDFLARMSHEIRTPMNAILGITEIQLQDETHPLLTKEAFERIYNSGSLLLGIINDILDLSKIEAGKLVLIPAQYDTASLIHDTTQLIILRYETKPIEFVLDVKEDLPLLLIGDELRIKQILNNLLSNAFKYTEDGTVTLTVYAEPTEPPDPLKKILVFIVTDTGQGMTPEQIQKLGTEYSRFNMEANRKTEGTGLGMNITQNLIHLMSGTIAVESAPGKGSTFTVRLPQDCEDPAVIGKKMADNLMELTLDNSVKLRDFQMNRDYMPYGRVLVVDDVETNLYVARGLIAPYGISVETALSGFEAIEKIKNGLTYDIIFMDHMMPTMDGIEAANVIRDLGYAKPIVALTANALAGQATMFMENGFDDFISKPIDMRQLNMTLNKLIRDKYPADVVEAAKKQKERLYSGGIREKPLGPELAEIFVRDAKKALTIMQTIYLNNFRRDADLSTFIINVHAMKSALANIGETTLSAMAATLEQSGREENVKLILAELPSFLEMLHTVIKKLESAAVTTEDDVGDNQYLKEKLQAVKEACALYDKKTAKDTLAEIRKKTWPKPVKEQLSDIGAHLLHSDFDSAVQAIDGFVPSIS